MNYTLHQLQIFREVCKQRSITRAANEMLMTQPALSIQLKQFQQQFEIPLIEIIGKKIHITEFGQSILAVTENILNEAEQLKFKTKEYKGLVTGKLRIASVSTGKYVLPYFIEGFSHAHSGVDLLLDVSNKDQAIRSLKENTVDFALVSIPPQQLEVEEEPLLENKLFRVYNPAYDLNEMPVIFREEGSATRLVVSDFLGMKTERKKLQLTSNEAVKQAMIAGLGYSILPLIGIKNELNAGQLEIISTPGLPISTYWRLIWLKGKKLSPVSEAFLQHIKQNKNEIIQKHFKWYLEFQEGK